MRMIIIEILSDAIDEYVQIGESTTEYLKNFSSAIVKIYKEEWLRERNDGELKTLLQRGSRLGFLAWVHL